MTVGKYFTEMLDPALKWDDVAEMVEEWGGPFCLKGVMHPEDAKRAAEIGCSGVILSNHGGRQLDGTVAPFDQLAAIVDAVGDKVDVIMDSGIQRGTHIVKALAMGAKAVGIGRAYLFPLAAAGQKGVERMIGLLEGGGRARHAPDGRRQGFRPDARQSQGAVEPVAFWRKGCMERNGSANNRCLLDADQVGAGIRGPDY